MLNFSVGETLRVDGDVYEVIGKISYRNLQDNCMWTEYRLVSHNMNRERWLSCDDVYHEYTISEVVKDASTIGYHQVDSGTEEVAAVWGNVDVEIGDRATFTEFEDITEEKTISWEMWDDGMEMSKGYYLDDYEIQRVNGYDGNGGGSSSFSSAPSYKGGKKTNIIVAIVIIFMLPNILPAIVLALNSGTPKISKYLADTSTYTYVTSITGSEKEKADVYETAYSIDTATRDIINAVDGKTTDVQQNTEDGDDSVAILTDNEYCLIYTSEDDTTLVQISTRKYAYANDDDPYRSRTGTRRYYRRFYYSRGYYSDMTDYSSTTSPYSSYSDSSLDSNSSDTYSTYSDSVRQASTTSRYSSGGGTSSGK